jgi:hypothetical protein
MGLLKNRKGEEYMLRLRGVIVSLDLDSENPIGVVRVTERTWERSEFPIRSIQNNVVLVPGIEVNFLVATLKQINGPDLRVAIDVAVTEPEAPKSRDISSEFLQDQIDQEKIRDTKRRKKERQVSFLLPLLEEANQSCYVRAGSDTSGNGGPIHRSLQLYISKIAEGLNWGSSIENAGGNGIADVAINKNSYRIAFEISVSSDPSRELQNVIKNVRDGYNHVVSVSTDRRKLDRIKKRVANSLTGSDLSRVSFMFPEEVEDFLIGKEKEIPRPEDLVQMIRGYKVSVKCVGNLSEQSAAKDRMDKVFIKSIVKSIAKDRAQK